MYIIQKIQGQSDFQHRTAQKKEFQLRIEIIISRYSEQTKDSPYIFPVITATNQEEVYKQYRIELNYHNRKLKRLGEELGGNLSLSSYTARHTWATIARKHNIPISVISAGMGHTSEKTTRIYLASLENSVMDKANRGILGVLSNMVSM
ncbi:tyrosine-type recombinase/integrase [Odoribacter laneus]|uniref:tyrosine-type recombinase/integrase n=1 Tax=Odoribacter laneus TaxID=626933 RepID=UPI00189BCD64